MALGALEELAVDTDVIACGVGFAAEFGDYPAVDLHASRSDELFGVATAGDSRLCEDLLEAFKVDRSFVRLFFIFGECGDIESGPGEIIGSLLEGVTCGGCGFGFGRYHGIRFRPGIERIVEFGSIGFGLIRLLLVVVNHGEISLPASIPVRRGHVQKAGLFGRLGLWVGFGCWLRGRRGDSSLWRRIAV